MDLNLVRLYSLSEGLSWREFNLIDLSLWLILLLLICILSRHSG